MIVIADASPLIFLAKIRQLDLIHALLGPDVRVPQQVRQEVLAGACDPVEQERLGQFMAGCRIEVVRHPRQFAKAMSPADNAALTLALRCGADILLCDERITRNMAEIEGVRPLGTLGLLMRAVRKQRLSPVRARQLIDVLIGEHGFRIGVEVYQAVLAQLAPAADTRTQRSGAKTRDSRR